MYGAPSFRFEGKTLTATPAVVRAYRFVKGRRTEYSILGGSTAINPVVLDVVLFSPQSAETDLLSFRYWKNSEAWGHGRLGTSTTLSTIADEVHREGAVRIYAKKGNAASSPHWSDPKHRPALALAAVDTAKKARLELYISHGLYTREEGQSLLLKAINSLEIEPAAFSRLLDKINTEAYEHCAKIQAQIDAVEQSLAPLGVKLGQVGSYEVSNGVLVGIDYQHGEVLAITLAVPIGIVRFPEAGRFVRFEAPPRLDVLTDPATYGLPLFDPDFDPGRKGAFDSGFSMLYWDSERSEWVGDNLHARGDIWRYAQDMPALAELSGSWHDRREVHIYKRFCITEGRYAFSGRPEKLRQVIAEFLRATSLMKADMDKGLLLGRAQLYDRVIKVMKSFGQASGRARPG